MAAQTLQWENHSEFLYIQGQTHSQLQRSRRMFIFENLIIMYSSPIMTCLVQYQTFTVYHILCLDSMFLPSTRIVTLPSPFVLWPWYFLFSRIDKRFETWKVLFNFIYGSGSSSCKFIQLLWQWDTQTVL